MYLKLIFVVFRSFIFTSQKRTKQTSRHRLMLLKGEGKMIELSNGLCKLMIALNQNKEEKRSRSFSTSSLI